MDSWKYNRYWSLKEFKPRDEQKKIINEIMTAINDGYENIILEAGTGVGKSAIATTIANRISGSYILTMTKQLQNQYIDDFKHCLVDIKGKSNYNCIRFLNRTCKDCPREVGVELSKKDSSRLDEIESEISKLKKDFPNAFQNLEKYVELSSMKHTIFNKYDNDDISTCDNCPYRTALDNAKRAETTLTNYDYLYYAGNYAKQFTDRRLLILDETHNLEKKIMDFITISLSRQSIYSRYQLDIFYTIANENASLKSIESTEYWVNILNRLIDKAKKEKQNPALSISEKEDYDKDINRFKKMIKELTADENRFIIELPRKKDILHDKLIDNAFTQSLNAEIKPLMINEYSNEILHFGNQRLFLTGTLGDKDKFCEWIGIDPDSTYYIYMKSPFPVENRPIYKEYAGSMSGKNQFKEPNWKNTKAVNKIKAIIERHAGDNGVIHTASNQQAWWIREQLNEYDTIIATSSRDYSREDRIKQFENSDGQVILIGAGIKDGVDFKGDKCRFQVLFKMPFPSLGSKQTMIRMHHDKTWYNYQTIMPLMQSYGRGIRDMTDYCNTYVLDADFDRLLYHYQSLFNEYFLEAIVGGVEKSKTTLNRTPILAGGKC